MKKNRSIVKTFFISMSTVIFSLVLIVVILSVYQSSFDIDPTFREFSNGILDSLFAIRTSQLLFIAFFAVVISIIIAYFISSNIEKNFDVFHLYFHKAAHKLEKIDTNKLQFDEFISLANSVNTMIDSINEAHKELEWNQKYLQAILEAQTNMVLVLSSAENDIIESVNQAFLNYFEVESIEEFYYEYNSLTDVLKYEDLMLKDISINDKKWFEYILENPSITHKIVIERESLDDTFIVTASLVDIENVYRVVIALHKVTELEEQRKMFEKEASTDTLTRIANRLKFNAVLEQQVEISKRYGDDLSIILFDIDNFKVINDTYGHQVGDNVLVELSAVISESVRKSDTFARWGGEEFVIILPQTSLETAKILAEKLREKVAGYSFSDNLDVTCSFGVAQYQNMEPISDFLKHVDDALYQAKDAGKNIVVSDIY